MIFEECKGYAKIFSRLVTDLHGGIWYENCRGEVGMVIAEGSDGERIADARLMPWELIGGHMGGTWVLRIGTSKGTTPYWIALKFKPYHTTPL